MFKNNKVSLNTNLWGQNISLETGLLAKQATTSVLAKHGDTAVLAALVVGPETKRDFFPLQIIYEERLYAAGKIHGSRFSKREGKPSDNAVLIGRLVDRSLRSLFDERFNRELQIVITVLSLDEINPPDTISVLAASSACMLAGLEIETKQTSLPTLANLVNANINKKINNLLQINNPLENTEHFLTKQIKAFRGPVAALRIGLKKPETKNADSYLEDLKNKKIEPEFIIDPTYSQQEGEMLDLVIAGVKNTADSNKIDVCMLEAGSYMIPEEVFAKALAFSEDKIINLLNFQSKFVSQCQAYSAK